MESRRALVVFGLAALLLTPGATGSPDISADSTPPDIRPAIFGTPGSNGWYISNVTLNWRVEDTESPILWWRGCDPATVTVETAGAPFACEAASEGGTVRVEITIKVDKTPPSASPAPSPQPNQHGWHRTPLTVGFVATDNVSGPDQNSCTKHAYSGPDTEGRVFTGTCKDLAGNTSSSSAYTLKYDETAPSNVVGNASRSPDANGWYNHELTVAFTGSDPTSGIPAGGCTQTTYSAPDSGDASVTGTCRDRADNPSTAASFGFKYDDTEPEVTGVTPAPDPSGWYTEPVVFDFRGTDALSGLDSCPTITYDGPDSANATVVGECLDKAGNVGTRSFGLKYDDTGPQVTPSAEREPDRNGWYNHSVSVRFAGNDAASGLESCVPAEDYEGPDSVFVVLTGTCRDNAGNVALGSVALKYDSTAPQVAGASPDRAPDGNGWYNHPLTISFHGSDATSNIDACTVTRFVGPDNPSASLTGSCSDRAGNPSGPGAFAFKYDTTAPTIAAVKVQAGNRSATLTWETSSDTSLVEVVRRAGARGAGVPVYRGTGRGFTDTRLANGVRYRYRLTGYDEARNPATREVAATPTAPLLSPQAGAVVSSPPRLGWKARRGATYYNVQVWRGRRIFSAWPTGRSLKLPREWTYRGRRYRLTPGRYRWYVWPGLGRRAQKEFGPLLGSSSFRVR